MKDSSTNTHLYWMLKIPRYVFCKWSASYRQHSEQITNYFPNPLTNLSLTTVVQKINSRTFHEPLCLFSKIVKNMLFCHELFDLVK